MKVLKCTSVKLSEARLANLKMIAKEFGCMYNELPSLGELMNRIADGEIELTKKGRAWGSGLGLKAEYPSDPKQLSWVEPKGPVYAEVPVAPLSPYVKAIPFSENTCDTSEFDMPVPQRRPIAPVDAPQVAPKPISVSGPLSPDDKREMFDKLKGLMKKGSDLL